MANIWVFEDLNLLSCSVAYKKSFFILNKLCKLFPKLIYSLCVIYVRGLLMQSRRSSWSHYCCTHYNGLCCQMPYAILYLGRHRSATVPNLLLNERESTSHQVYANNSPMAWISWQSLRPGPQARMLQPPWEPLCYRSSSHDRDILGFANRYVICSGLLQIIVSGGDLWQHTEYQL